MKSFGPPSASYRSPDFSAIRGSLLTDSRIRHYIRAGYYGEELRQRELAAVKKKTKRKPPVLSDEDLSAAMSLLSTL
jgi:hypothetical protein